MSVAQQILRGASRLGEAFSPKATASLAARLFFSPRRLPAKVALTRSPKEEGPLPVGYFRRWSDGAPIYLLHGWEGSYHQFGSLVASLESRGFGAITLDPPAHGKAQGKQANLRGFADTLLSAQETLGIPFGAIGHSLGGLALMLALRDGLAARGAILISSPAGSGLPIRQFEDLLGLGERTRAELRSIIAARVQEDHESMHAGGLLKAKRPQGLIVHDDDDRKIPASHAGEILSAWPEASIMRTKGYGHNRVLNAAVAEKIGDWWRKFAKDFDAGRTWI